MSESGAPQLVLLNSLTREKNPFYPVNPPHVRWYSCGPTVYDASHMGHARSYITFDILRRVMRDYFRFDVEYVMNITDVDDKIILRARRAHLFENALASPAADAEQQVKEAVDAFEVKVKAETEPEKQKMLNAALTAAKEGIAAFSKSGKTTDDIKALITACKDPYSEYLDAKHGSEISDVNIFGKLTQYWEGEFFNDMKALNVEMPDRLPRVTEYVPEIVSYVKKIIANGYAYESNGSVYFDTAAFAKQHHYGKLVPEAVGDIAALADGEGALSSTGADKRSPQDFALWKASKPGEPSWESPWGKGRPGWHIECSAMAEEAYDGFIDVHSGGVDLKFPHHDNEIAQAEGYHDCQQWCNYFLHAGHLTIEGQKMSKSLKNFITIREALQQYTARQLRLTFLTHAWHSTLDYSNNTMTDAVHLEKTFNEFFLNVKSLLHSQQGLRPAIGEPEKELLSKIMEIKDAVHVALCDSVDTPSAMRHLRDMVSACNVYIQEREQAKATPHAHTLAIAAAYATKMFKIFGVIASSDSIGFTGAGDAADQAAVDEKKSSLKAVVDDFFAQVAEEAAVLASEDDEAKQQAGKELQKLVEEAKHAIKL